MSNCNKFHKVDKNKLNLKGQKMKKQITYMLLTGVCLLLVAMQATAQNTTICVEDYTVEVRDIASGYTYQAWDRVESSGGVSSSWHSLGTVSKGNNTVQSYCHPNCQDHPELNTYWVGVMVIRSDGQIRYGVSSSLLPDKNLRLNPGFIQVSAF